MRNLVLQFIASRTKREQSLLFITLLMLFVFILFEYVYTPLLERYNALHLTYTHSLDELAHAQHSIQDHHNSVDTHNMLQENSIAQVQKDLAMITQSLNTFANDTPPNVFALMDKIINFSRDKDIDYSAMIPHAATQSLEIQGNASLESLKSLLGFIESSRLISLDALSFDPLQEKQMQEEMHDDIKNGRVHFSLLAVIYPSPFLLQHMHYKKDRQIQ